MTGIVAAIVCAASASTVYEATLGESEKTGEISTAEMKQVLEKKTATVFDSRPAREYAVEAFNNVAFFAGDPAQLRGTAEGTRTADK